MKHLLSFFITFLMMFTPSNQNNKSNTIYSRCYIVMDAYSKEVLEGNNIEVARSVASILCEI